MLFSYLGLFKLYSQFFSNYNWILERVFKGAKRSSNNGRLEKSKANTFYDERKKICTRSLFLKKLRVMKISNLSNILNSSPLLETEITNYYYFKLLYGCIIRSLLYNFYNSYPLFDGYFKSYRQCLLYSAIFWILWAMRFSFIIVP